MKKVVDKNRVIFAVWQERNRFLPVLTAGKTVIICQRIRIFQFYLW